VPTSVALVQPNRLARFLHDCWCLWLLITGRAEKADEPEPIRTDWKPTPYVPIDLDAWEAKMWDGGKGAFWFDPMRYDGTRFAWPARIEAAREQLRVAQTTFGEIFARTCVDESREAADRRQIANAQAEANRTGKIIMVHGPAGGPIEIRPGDQRFDVWYGAKMIR
jgi:hypothetical protein